VQRIVGDQHLRCHQHDVEHVSDVLAARNVDSIHDEIELNNSIQLPSPK